MPQRYSSHQAISEVGGEVMKQAIGDLFRADGVAGQSAGKPVLQWFAWNCRFPAFDFCHFRHNWPHPPLSNDR